MNGRYLAIAAGVVLILLVASLFIISSPGSKPASTTSSGSSSSSTQQLGSASSTGSPKSSSSSGPSTTSSGSGSSTVTSVGFQQYDFLIFTQKGIAELASPSGSLLGYQRLYNISDSVPAQTFYWEGYPTQGAPRGNFIVPINNGTLEVVNGSTMKVTSRLSVGTSAGFIGVSISPDEKLAAVADGPSGIVEVINLATLQVSWKQVYDMPSGTSTAFPCDIRWAPDQQTLAIPMRLNGTVDVVSATTGAIQATAGLPIAAKPFMLSINSQGTMLAVELSGNNTDVFYSYPTMNALGKTAFASSSFGPTRGVFTPDGSYYLEASGSTNAVAVISTSTFAVVNTINLPASSSPGLADMELTPDGHDAYVVMHGTPTSGGIIYTISLSAVTTEQGPDGSVALTTAPAFALPISVGYGNYLADNVLSPPVTGLHC